MSLGDDLFAAVRVFCVMLVSVEGVFLAARLVARAVREAGNG